MPRHITRDELWAKIERGDDFVLIEALAPAAYAYGHLPGGRESSPRRREATGVAGGKADWKEAGLPMEISGERSAEPAETPGDDTSSPR